MAVRMLSDLRAKLFSRISAPEVLSWKTVGLIGAGVSVIMTLILASGVSQVVNDAVARRLEYSVRRRLHKSPTLDSRIKIFAFDDASATALGYADVSLAQWEKILTAIGRSEPRAVFIDKVFALPLKTGKSSSFVSTLRSLPFPIVAGAYRSPKPIQGRSALPLNAPDFQVESTLAGTSIEELSWLRIQGGTVYGPSEEIRSGFSHLGHLELQYYGRIAPLIRVSNLSLLPHWSLFAGNSMILKNGKIFLDQNEIPIDSNLLLMVNLVEPSTLLNRSRRLYNVLVDGEKGDKVAFVQKGDIVVILPAMFTGNMDFKDTPVGTYPGGFIQVSMLNSVLTGNWIRELRGEIPVSIAMVWLACLLPAYLPSIYFLSVLSSVTILLTVIGLMGFTFYGWVFPWLFPVISLLFSGLLTYASKLWETEKRMKLLRHDLSGKLAPLKLTKMLARCKKLEATGQVLTVMFIDIIGFSKFAEQQTPKDAFSSLKKVMSELRRIVHKHHGDVERTMGDGMLCLFGFELEDGEKTRSHADMAVSCAIEIQNTNVKRIVREKGSEPIFPLRIGINTTGTYVGDLGDSARTDLTVIGSGVNFAQRLENACGWHMVMLGSSTKDLLTDTAVKPTAIKKRLIGVKHYLDSVEAYELDPFHDNPELLAECEEIYRKFINADRLETRWPAPTDDFVTVATKHGLGSVVNFSANGLAIALPQYLSAGLMLNMNLTASDPSLKDQIRALEIQPLVVEVRWARPVPNGKFIHGCLYKNLDENQKFAFLEALKTAASKASIAPIKLSKAS